ncbi:iron ABC transporter permease [Streptomyces sp. NPDC053741]|uniref:Transport system permease protein n=1 Tax=Streptomyces pratensis (strain ATCC 33331 / IAF-45CD) TaxID=591167 RepID=A0A8D3WFT7_STRFA|nr:MULTISPECIES: iron ABC transporter permease [Streptomyces]MBD2834277.1 iron ABC transporter permease [Streptomyces pratensis]MYT50290.1 Fe(3+)-hydroxamate ABC transporter permease FhuB [Streptomyces sp. SID7815]MYT55860.1 Fe(3+)-hydroxamate ABC transporter permease FhuB [Streptomyces sp. SID7834]TPN03403.1 iron ABC transporter permease [Mesorhizobium sp. B2-3-3]MDX3185044.1 iron ABC transporter permease [Streptomyces sp. ME02-7008A-1]
MSRQQIPAPGGKPLPRAERGGGPTGVLVLVLLLATTALVGLWHLTQGTSGVGVGDLVRYLAGDRDNTGGAPVGEIFTGSRLPRLLAGIAVGFALGCAGALLQSVTHNALASPDTLAVTAGAYFTLTLVAAFGLAVPLWASGAVAFAGGLVAAALVLLLAGRAAGTAGTRLILAGSATALALDAATGMLLILFNKNTTGLFAWGSGSLAQLNIDASVRAFPLVAVVLCVALALSRRLDVMNLGDDAASTLGVPIRSTRVAAVLCAVLLTGTAVTLAGPIAFVGLGAPVAARLIAGRARALRRHLFLVPAAGLLGALLILLADAVLRALQGADGAASIPTGVPTALLGAVVIIVLAMRLRDTGRLRQPPAARVAARSRRAYLLVVAVTVALLAGAVVVAVLAGSLWLKTGDVVLWIQGTAPDLIGQALDDRFPRVVAAVLAGAALGLAGCVVQSSVRNPLAEPGVLGITAGAGLGAASVVTSGLSGGQPVLVAVAVAAGLATFGLIALLAWRGGFLPDRFVLIGIGCGYGLSSVTTFLLLRADPYNTPRIFTWLSGTTYGRTLPDVVPVAVALALALPTLLAMRRQLDLLAVDEDTPRIVGVRVERARFAALAIAAVLAALSVIAVGVVGFVGLVAPHLARSLVGARHGRAIPVAMLLGGLLVCVADALGRTLVAPAQVPAGLMIALVGAPYFVWVLRKSRA